MATHPDYPGASSVLKKGRVYWRYRASRNAKEISLPGIPGSPEFVAAYEAAVQGAPAPGRVIPMPGAALPKTFAAARRLFEKSSDYLDADRGTQINKDRYLDRFVAEPVVVGMKLTWGETPVEMMDFQQLDALVARIKQQDGANVAKRWLEVINNLILVALRQKPQWINYHPGFGLTCSPIPSDGHREWSRAEREQYEEHHPIGSPARTAYELGYWIGNRRSDVARLRHDQREDHDFETEDGEVKVVDAFAFRQKKNGRLNGGKEMFLPVLPWLDEALAPLDRAAETVLVQLDGKSPYSDKALTGMMQKWTRQAGLPAGLTLHGLRKSLGNRLAELGLSARQIMEVLGHSNLGAAEVYVRKANKKRLAIDAYEALEKAERRRRLKVVKVD